MKLYLGLNSETDFDFNLFPTFSGVGMIRGENLCINKLQYFTNKEFCDYVTDYLVYVSSKFSSGMVWYRTADLVCHQVNVLDGCDVEMDEQQYLTGTRGIRRNLLFKDTYINELTCFVNAYKINKNLGLLIPFISSVDEFIEVKNILSELGYDGKIGIMVEIPSVMLLLDEFDKLGVDNYTIGVNDLTSNLLGANRDISCYSINNIAVYRAIDYIVSKVHSFGKEVTLAGYLNKNMYNYVMNIGVDILNVHYNEIPILFEVDDNKFYTQHYDSIKARYKVRKKQKSNE